MSSCNGTASPEIRVDSVLLRLPKNHLPTLSWVRRHDAVIVPCCVASWQPLIFLAVSSCAGAKLEIDGQVVEARVSQSRESINSSKGKGKGEAAVGSSRKLFVGDLHFETTDSEMKTFFESFGEVDEVEIVKEQGSGRPRGFGFVTYKEAEAAKRCMDAFVTPKLHGKAVKLTPAVPREQMRRGGKGGGYDSGRWDRDRGWSGGRGHYDDRRYGYGRPHENYDGPYGESIWF